MDLTSQGELLSKEEKKVYQSGVGKLLFLMRYSCPDILNAVRELSRWMSNSATIDLKKVILQTTYNCSLYLALLMGIIDAQKKKFIIKGRGDSNYATNEETRKSVSSIEVILNGIPVVIHSIG